MVWTLMVVHFFMRLFNVQRAIFLPEKQHFSWCKHLPFVSYAKFLFCLLFLDWIIKCRKTWAECFNVESPIRRLFLVCTLMATEVLWFLKKPMLYLGKVGIYCYHDGNGDNGDYSFLELVVKCFLDAQILLWVYIHKWGTLPNPE